jgi:hypothetical protein
MIRYIILFALLLSFAACGEPNHYDSHVGEESGRPADDHERDTIQGRAPDSTVVVSDSTNTGIGDTTLGGTSH